MMSGQVPRHSQRTPPDVKWLLNERAALAGEVSKSVDKLRALQLKQERLEAQFQSVAKLIARNRQALIRAQASVDALDTAINFMHNQAEPAAAGVVDAWAGKYGQRGGLGDYLEELLPQAAPEPLTMTVLINLAARQFSLNFQLPAERRSFRKSVTSALGAMLKRGLIEPLHDRTEGSHGIWRWKEQIPTLDALAQRAGGLQA